MNTDQTPSKLEHDNAVLRDVLQRAVSKRRFIQRNVDVVCAECNRVASEVGQIVHAGECLQGQMQKALADTTAVVPVCNHGIRSPHYCGDCDAEVQAGLVPLADVTPLIDALECAMVCIDKFNDGSAGWTKALAAFRAKHGGVKL